MLGRGATIQTVAAPAPVSRAEVPLVIPQHVFAAGRQSFECVVRRNFHSYDRVIAAVFDALPLEDHGWDRVRTDIKFIGNTHDAFPIFRLTRL